MSTPRCTKSPSARSTGRLNAKKQRQRADKSHRQGESAARRPWLEGWVLARVRILKRESEQEFRRKVDQFLRSWLEVEDPMLVAAIRAGSRQAARAAVRQLYANYEEDQAIPATMR
jgi:hypothetical protein